MTKPPRTAKTRLARRAFVKNVGRAVAGAALGGTVLRARSDAAPAPGGVGRSPTFHGPVGLQLYSLRRLLKEQGPLAVLDQTRRWGFRLVEVSALGDLSPKQYQAELQRRELVPISKAFPYGRLQNDLDAVLTEAQALGVRYVGTASIPHKKPFDEKQCRAAIAVFNRAGRAASERGLKFYYHNHGQEFAPHADGTLFDLLAAETDPRLVFFEMDVLWTVHPGQDPVQLMKRHPGRWLLMHLKDLRRGVPTGAAAGKIEPTDDVALGTGQVDWPPLLRAAQKAGVQCYFIEDESPNVLEQVPQSLRFLEQMTI